MGEDTGLSNASKRKRSVSGDDPESLRLSALRLQMKLNFNWLDEVDPAHFEGPALEDIPPATRKSKRRKTNKSKKK